MCTGGRDKFFLDLLVFRKKGVRFPGCGRKGISLPPGFLQECSCAVPLFEE